ncbi:MAG: PTS fructose transporter subunit IIABC [Brevinema sp.]
MSYFSPKLVLLDSSSTTKTELLNEMAQAFVGQDYATDAEQLVQELQRREDIHATIISDNIAMPHAKLSSIKKAGVVIARVPKGILWDQANSESAKLVFMVGVPEKDNNTHLDIISLLGSVLDNKEVYQKMMNATKAEDILSLLTLSTEKTATSSAGKSVDIVAVTACPTGIAHTYMAAEELKKKGAEQNLVVRVETNGADGAKNILTEEEIAQAKVVIIASDRELDLSRFHGKKMISVSAGDAVRNAKDVITRALSPSTTVYTQSNDQSATTSSVAKKGVYAQLMTGVSYMLPFVVGGGILIAFGFMFGITAHDPTASDYHPLAQFFNTLGGAGAFSLMIPILAGFIGFSIGERPALMPAMVGGLLSAQNGGGFLGGLFAGFIGGYAILILKKIFSYLPRQLEGLKPVLFYPVFGLILMGAVVLPLMSYISTINSGMSDFLNSLSNSNLIFLGLILGGMMAVDMGGPVNKAAFTFGIAAISANNYYPHAAVMAGGMVPPLGLALATSFAKNLFNPAEREAGITCYALGACFITEGAIPFAASYPLIVIPSAILGSAVAGALSMAFGCQLPAPHGGIFVFPLITNVALYILSILIGSMITAISIVFFLGRKKSKIS